MLSSFITLEYKKASILCCWINYTQDIGVSLGGGVGTRHKEGIAPSDIFGVMCSNIILISNPDLLGGLILLPMCAERNTHFPLYAEVTRGVLWQSCVEKLYSTCLHMFGPVPSPCFPSDQKHIYLQLFFNQKKNLSKTVLIF